MSAARFVIIAIILIDTSNAFLFPSSPRCTRQGPRLRDAPCPVPADAIAVAPLSPCSPRRPQAGRRRAPPPRRPRAWFPRIPARLGALRADGTAGFGVRRRPRAGSCPAADGRRAGRGGAARTPRDGRGGEVLPRPPAIKGCRRDARRGASGAGTEEGGRNLGEEKGERPRRRSPSLNRVNGSAAQGEEGAPAGSRAEALGGAGPPPRELRDPLGQRHAKVGPRSPLALGRVRSPLFAEMRRVSRGSAGGPAGETSVGFPARAVSTAHVSAERSSPREGLSSRQRCLFSIRPPPNGISSALAPRCCSARCDLTGDGTGAEREKKTFDSSSSELF